MKGCQFVVGVTWSSTYSLDTPEESLVCSACTNMCAFRPCGRWSVFWRLLRGIEIFSVFHIQLARNAVLQVVILEKVPLCRTKRKHQSDLLLTLTVDVNWLWPYRT